LQQARKLHPFDFTGEDLAEIKKLFPEFKPKRQSSRASTKVQGVPVIELKRKLKEKINLDGQGLQRLIDKLDHRNDEKITWSEFLTFLENEGQRREVVNDA
jgi:Ca2+-binding EF-hand superfamily protein